MHMIDVMKKLQEIAEAGYDNQDIQRGIDAASKHTVAEAHTQNPAYNQTGMDENAGSVAKPKPTQFNFKSKEIQDLISKNPGHLDDLDRELGPITSPGESETPKMPKKGKSNDWESLGEESWRGKSIYPPEPKPDHFDDLVKSPGESETPKMPKKGKSNDWESLEEGGSGDAPISKMSRAELIDYLGTTDAEVANMSDDELRDAANEKTMDMQSVDNNQPAVEETVEVPVNELAELMQLAGYTNYAEKIEEYANEPDPEYMDAEEQLIGLSGGLNGPKKMYAAAAGGDNPMDQEPREVTESTFESFYKKYDKFVAELTESEQDKFDFKDGNGPVPAHQHSNGSGWVADTATVAGTAYVGPYARVFGNAQVTGNAWVADAARVFGNAQVSDNTEVSDNAQVSDNTEVSGNARVFGNARVSDNAQVFGDARVFGDAQVFGTAQVSDNTEVSGDAEVSGDDRVLH